MAGLMFLFLAIPTINFHVEFCQVCPAFFAKQHRKPGKSARALVKTWETFTKKYIIHYPSALILSPDALS
jgi:hypothetical protein